MSQSTMPTPDAFQAAVETNLNHPSDFILVNYQIATGVGAPNRDGESVGPWVAGYAHPHDVRARWSERLALAVGHRPSH